MNFDQAYEILIDPQHEGTYSNDPGDPGGETYRGIARTRNPAWRGWTIIDVHRGSPTFVADLDRDKGLQDAVKQFYRLQFWGPAGCDAVPEALKYELFDFAVNTSAAGRPTTAIKALQRAAGADADGVLGPKTLLITGSLDPNVLFRRFAAQVIRYYTGLDPALRARFLAGWMNRLATNLETS